MIRIEMIWLALGASDLRAGIDVLLAQVLRSFAGGAQPHHAYRFYFAYDHNDPVYEVQANRDARIQFDAGVIKTSW